MTKEMTKDITYCYDTKYGNDFIRGDDEARLLIVIQISID